MRAVTAVLLFVAAFEGVFAKLTKYGKLHGLKEILEADISNPCGKLKNYRHSYKIVEAKHDLCPGDGVCCQLSWHGDCAEGCARNICIDNGGKWINHGDYDHHPYMCEVSSDDGDNECGWASWDCTDCIRTEGCVYVVGKPCIYEFGKEGRAAKAAGTNTQECAGNTSEGCHAHTECGRHEYCDTSHDCWDRQSCPNYNDAVDGQCPRDTEHCDEHDDCAANEYCDRNHNCYENDDGDCEEHMDPVDGWCPEYKAVIPPKVEVGGAPEVEVVNAPSHRPIG